MSLIKQGQRMSKGALRAIVVTLGLAIGASVLVPSASAAVEPRDRVYASYLPTVQQATRIYPFLAEGSRSVFRYRGQGGSFSCWDWTKALEAADGRWSAYNLKSGASPYFKGLEDPGVFVFKFHTRRQALAAFWLQQRFVRNCMGIRSRAGTTAHLWRQRVPFMGQGSVAYRSFQEVEVGAGTSEHREFHIAVLRGRYLVNIYNQAMDFQPRTRNGVRLAKITLGNIG